MVEGPCLGRVDRLPGHEQEQEHQTGRSNGNEFNASGTRASRSRTSRGMASKCARGKQQVEGEGLLRLEVLCLDIHRGAERRSYLHAIFSLLVNGPTNSASARRGVIECYKNSRSHPAILRIREDS